MRLRAEPESFVFFMARPGMAGTILDVCEGGLAFSYLAAKRRTEELVDLTLVCIPRNFRSQSMPIRVVSDFKMSRLMPNGERRCGVEFIQLSREQELDIAGFMECCTSGTA